MVIFVDDRLRGTGATALVTSLKLRTEGFLDQHLTDGAFEALESSLAFEKTKSCTNITILATARF